MPHVRPVISSPGSVRRTLSRAVFSTLLIISMALMLVGDFVDLVAEYEKINQRLAFDVKERTKELKTLSGLLPICASCKKIRDDRGYWNQIENFLLDHSDATFSHGICPECAEKLYPGMAPKTK